MNDYDLNDYPVCHIAHNYDLNNHLSHTCHYVLSPILMKEGKRKNFFFQHFQKNYNFSFIFFVCLFVWLVIFYFFFCFNQNLVFIISKINKIKKKIIFRHTSIFKKEIHTAYFFCLKPIECNC